MSRTFSGETDYLSPFERQDYLVRLHDYIVQVFEGRLALGDVPSQYLDDVIATGFYEYSGHKMTVDQYMRFVFFSSYLDSRCKQDVDLIDKTSSP